MLRTLTLFFCLLPIDYPAASWGFWAHKRINRLAVFRLPPPMMGFYKQHLDYITEAAVNPDRRRYAVVGEAEKHYIDLDVYGDSARYLPRKWEEAVARFGEDSLRRHGIAPWQIPRLMRRLTAAFKDGSSARILQLSADLGHYIGDIHVPLHTTRNYNGQLTGQEGIHGFWESRVPELFAENYDLWIGKAEYISDPSAEMWRIVFEAHAAKDSVLSFERELTRTFPATEKYVYEERNGVIVKTYARSFSEKYHRMLGGQVERQMKAAIRVAGDCWYTCWVDAGQPDLVRLITAHQPDAGDSTLQGGWIKRLLNIRPED